MRLALEALERAVAPQHLFDPAQASVTWRIAATDYTESAVLLPLLSCLRRDAPGSRLAVFELNPGQIKRQAEQGDIDLFFHLREGAPSTLHQRLLFTERYVLAARRGHPALKRRPSLKQFCQLEHVIVSPEGGGFHAATDDALAGGKTP